MSVRDNIENFISGLPSAVTLVAVTKTRAHDEIMEVYNTGFKTFGENRVQELIDKAQIYNDSQIRELITILNFDISEEEIRTLIFGKDIELEDLGKRSLSELKRDILKELKVNEK